MHWKLLFRRFVNRKKWRNDKIIFCRFVFCRYFTGIKRSLSSKVYVSVSSVLSILHLFNLGWHLIRISELYVHRASIFKTFVTLKDFITWQLHVKRPIRTVTLRTKIGALGSTKDFSASSKCNENFEREKIVFHLWIHTVAKKYFHKRGLRSVSSVPIRKNWLTTLRV